ncbi:response regulator [Methanobacterium alcaliphilum]|uniref:response regulator n=1 Tax=Methanobacterium alcaliphilum TaxID=392018 RepID=UPI00200A3488|nr:response regulator [Methanobacterium alcaliphilum]MCK9150419.1 response regulator [Methanobacterium alcaliphilum]
MDVLIAEYESGTILDLKNVLDELGHNVIAVASNGEEAIKYLEDLSPDLIIINIQLKGKISGLETGKEIEYIHKIPIIFLTVFIKNCLNKSLQLPEGAIVLSKPLTQENVRYSIYRAFSG